MNSTSSRDSLTQNGVDCYDAGSILFPVTSASCPCDTAQLNCGKAGASLKPLEGAFSNPRFILAELTEAQLECLQLVRRRKTAKQIARSLNITHHAVEQRLKSVRRKLGVATTAEAVDLLEAAENAAYGEAVYGLPDVAITERDWEPLNLSPPYGGDSGKEILTALSPAARSDASHSPNGSKVIELLFGSAEAMSWRHRALLMAALALAAVAVVSLLISLIDGLSRLNP